MLAFTARRSSRVIAHYELKIASSLVPEANRPGTVVKTVRDLRAFEPIARSRATCKIRDRETGEEVVVDEAFPRSPLSRAQIWFTSSPRRASEYIKRAYVARFTSREARQLLARAHGYHVSIDKQR